MSTGARLKKLTSMPASELGGRLAQLTYRTFERHVPGMTGATPAGAMSGITASRPLFPSLTDLPATIQTLRVRFADQVRRTIVRADGLTAGRIVLFGEARQFPHSIDWHADPVSGAPWPRGFFADVPIGNRALSPGDAKDVWELNRHQFLLDTGKAWRLTGREEYATCAMRLVDSWIDANPYATGVNWAGPLEVAYRALSWLWLYHLLSDAPPPSDGFQARWLASLNDHGRFLHRHLELFESPYNHLIGEAAVLYLLGLQFPRLVEASQWHRRGRRVLETRLAAQFYPDGGSVEQATVYHHATVAYLLLAAVAARQHGEPFDSRALGTLERALEFSAGLVQPDGRHPAIGDNDDARPLAFDCQDTWDYRHLLAAGAVLFQRPDFKFVAASFGEDALWLLGPEAGRQFDSMASAPPATGEVFDQSGYAVLRSSWQPDADYVCFDCGEQGGGLRADDVPSATHGHADALSVVASLAGMPVLVDAGFYTYDGERDWERHFRATAAHNTVCVDGRDQATHVHKMAWTHAPNVTLHDWSMGPGGRWACASHDGYARNAGVVHRRTVWLQPQGCVVLLDELIGDGHARAELVFQIAPEHAVSLNDRDAAAAIGGRFILVWCATTDVAGRLHYGGPSVEEGWVAPRLGHRRPAPRCVLSWATAAPVTVLTALVDRQVWSSARCVRGEGSLAVMLQGDSGSRTIMAPLTVPCTGPHIKTDAALVGWNPGAEAASLQFVRGTYAEVLP